ncbi:hypothetical protein J9303_11550 [Bacillaceae bacterium Marseille-Q3522]|nr:hypothetical protein [Bacillaceae bacterium Marseille-Q3522]
MENDSNTQQAATTASVKKAKFDKKTEEKGLWMREKNNPINFHQWRFSNVKDVLVPTLQQDACDLCLPSPPLMVSHAKPD